MEYGRGVLYGLGADILWGFAFIVPKLLPEYGGMEITFGRYGFYGMFSLALWLLHPPKKEERQGIRRRWKMLLLLACCGNVGYYLLLVWGIQMAGVTTASLVIGMLPVTVALYGNWYLKEFPAKILLPPLGLIGGGLVTVNSLYLDGMGGSQYLWGLAALTTALGMWTWYSAANARLLRLEAGVTAASWSTGVGLATLCLSPVFGWAGEWLWPGSFAPWRSFYEPEGWKYLAGSAVLGLGASWAGTVLWNRAATFLPTSLAGQLIIGETVVVLAAGFCLDGRWPYPKEGIGIIMMITGVIWSLKRIGRQRQGGGRCEERRAE